MSMSTQLVTDLDPGYDFLSIEWWLPVWMRHLVPSLPAESDEQQRARRAVARLRSFCRLLIARHFVVFFVWCSFPRWTELWVSIPVAIVITLVRIYLSDWIATKIVVGRLKLTQSSLRERNQYEKDPQKRIPTWSDPTPT